MKNGAKKWKIKTLDIDKSEKIEFEKIRHGRVNVRNEQKGRKPINELDDGHEEGR